MKKACFLFLCALLLSLAPTTFAAEGDGIAAIGQVFDQLISFFVGIGESLSGAEAGISSAADPESGILFPPGG